MIVCGRAKSAKFPSCRKSEAENRSGGTKAASKTGSSSVSSKKSSSARVVATFDIFWLCTFSLIPVHALHAPRRSKCRASRICGTSGVGREALRARGGNDQHIYPSDKYRPLTIGDLDDNPRYIGTPLRDDHSYKSDDYTTIGRQSKLRPIQEIVREFSSKLRTSSPILFYVMTSSLLLFVAWQIPALSASPSSILQRHFLCSRTNVLRKRYHTALLSAISHSSPMHLLLNMYACYVFGSSARKILLAAYRLPLWPLVLGGAIAGSLAFLALSPRGGSCMGLSGATLALLAFDARANPNKELGFVVYVVPVRMPAEYALVALLVTSCFGAFIGGGGAGGVAHAAHLGGLLFGIAYFDLLKRGYLVQVANHWKMIRARWNGSRAMR